MSIKPAVLFVSAENGGTSQMAAGLMRQAVRDGVTVDSAGTEPGRTVKALSAEVLPEVGVDITDQSTRQLTDAMIAGADRVIVLCRDDIPGLIDDLADQLGI